MSATTSARFAAGWSCSTPNDQYVLLADTQALTDNADDPEKVGRNVIEVALDYLAVGIDPTLYTICLQSALPALAELTFLYLNFVSFARLERNPTIKDEYRHAASGATFPQASYVIQRHRQPTSQRSRPLSFLWARIRPQSLSRPMSLFAV